MNLTQCNKRTLINDIKDSRGDVCFVAMDFSNRFNPVYEEIIAPAITDAGIRAIRVDEILSSAGIVVDEIITLIQASRIAIFDITGRNSNVLMELGMAQALNKEVIIISQDNSIPFDIQPRRIIHYDISENGKALLRKELNSILKASVYPSERILRQMLHHCSDKNTYVIYGQVSKKHIKKVSPPVDKDYMERLDMMSSETTGLWKLALAYHKISWSLGKEVTQLTATNGCRAPKNIIQQGNAFVFGGPGANPYFTLITDSVSQIYRNSLSMKSTEKNGKTRFRITKGGDIFPHNQDELLEQSIDVGIMMRFPNPNLKNSIIWLAAGIRTYGTEAAIQLLVTPSLIKSLDMKRDLLADPSIGIWAVVEAEFSAKEKKLIKVNVHQAGKLELK